MVSVFVCLLISSLKKLCVRVVGGCCGKWGATPGDLYGCRKINVDFEPRYGWQYPRAYMWQQWEAFGMRLASECCRSAYGCSPARESEQIYVRPDWVETGLRHTLRGQAEGQALKQSGPSSLLFQVGSQEILCGCLCESEAQRPSGVATRMRRRRCVKRYATAKPCSHSDTNWPFLVGESNRAKQSLARNRQKLRKKAPQEGPQKQLGKIRLSSAMC